MRSPPRRRACARDRHGLGEALEAPLVPGGRGTTYYSPTEGSLEFRRPKDTIELFTPGNAGRGRARECFSNAVLLHLALPTSLFLDFTQRLQLVCVHAWAHRAQSGATQSYTGLTRKTSLRTRDSKLATQRCQTPPSHKPCAAAHVPRHNRPATWQGPLRIGEFCAPRAGAEALEPRICREALALTTRAPKQRCGRPLPRPGQLRRVGPPLGNCALGTWHKVFKHA